MGIFDKLSKKSSDNTEGSPITQSIIKSIGCPHHIINSKYSNAQVNQAYQEALARGKREGFTPVLVTSDETLEEWFGILQEEDSYSRAQLLEKNVNDGQKILETRYQEYIVDYIEDYIDPADSEEADYEKREPDEFLGELADGDTISELVSLNNLNSDGTQEVILFEIPTVNPWEVIAWIPFGGWNECPPAEEMMAVCRYWYEKYKAIPAVISHDELEFYLETPIKEENTAWKLAKEHYAFCPDRIDQCTQSGTAGELADTILGSNVWYFWWD